MTYYLYILENPDGRTYVGQSNDLDRRLIQHNNPEYSGTLYTKRIKGPWRLIYSEEHASRSDSMAREKYFKTGKGRAMIAEIQNKICAGSSNLGGC